MKSQKAYATTLALLMVVPVLLSLRPVTAAELRNRSIRVRTSEPNAVTQHRFSFEIVTSGTIGSIRFQYCDNSPLFTAPCSAPAGLSLVAATIGSQSGVTGFTIHPSSTGNTMIMTRAPAAEGPQTATYSLDTVTNPSTPSASVFVRISTYASNDASGPRIDDGAVVFSTSGALGTAVFVPPYLTFCTGVSVGPDCSSATGSRLDFGELSAVQTRAVTSQFAGATNDFNGYVVSLLGTTMTSGNNIINAPSSPVPSTTGTSQYAINLRANSSPSVGQNPLGAGTLSPDTDYNIPNQFTFRNGSIASSPLSTDFNTITVSYIVNVPSGQAPGIYSTTMTYVATALF